MQARNVRQTEGASREKALAYCELHARLGTLGIYHVRRAFDAELPIRRDRLLDIHRVRARWSRGTPMRHRNGPQAHRYAASHRPDRPRATGQESELSSACFSSFAASSRDRITTRRPDELWASHSPSRDMTDRPPFLASPDRRPSLPSHPSRRVPLSIVASAVLRHKLSLSHHPPPPTGEYGELVIPAGADGLRVKEISCGYRTSRESFLPPYIHPRLPGLDPIDHGSNNRSRTAQRRGGNGGSTGGAIHDAGR